MGIIMDVLMPLIQLPTEDAFPGASWDARWPVEWGLDTAASETELADYASCMIGPEILRVTECCPGR